MGVYLGLGDLALFTHNMDVTVYTFHWDDEHHGVPMRSTLTEMLTMLTNRDDFAKNDVKHQDASDKTWNVVWTQANHERGPFLRLNHAMPLFARVQMLEEWKDKVARVQTKSEQKINKIKKQIEESSDDSDCGMEHSFRDLLETLKLKQQFYDTFIAGDYLPSDVPGDGNCLLWTMSCLQRGPGKQQDLVSKDRVAEMRRDAWL